MSSLEQLLMDVKESLERQISALERKLEDGFATLNAKFDSQGARLDRHEGFWQSGRRWSATMDSWAEKVDQALAKKDAEIADLRERLNKIERRQNP